MFREEFSLEQRDLDVYSDEEVINQRIEDGDLNPADAAFLLGNNRGNNYLEEEEE